MSEFDVVLAELREAQDELVLEQLAEAIAAAGKQ